MSSQWSAVPDDLSAVEDVEHNQIVQGDAADICRGFDDVQLTVTSPPYLDAIDYEEYTATGDGDYTERDGEDLAAWKAEMARVFEAVLDATRDSGFCAVNIGHISDQNGDPVALPHQFATVMRDLGWQFHERIIWNKVTGGKATFGTTIQHPQPTYYYPNKMHEEIQVWRNGDVQNRKTPDGDNEITEFVKKEVANNVWHVAPEPSNSSVDHPCPFPEELPHRLVKWYSHADDLVLDPFVGSGTTTKVAKHLGRGYVGIDVDASFVETARERLDEAYDRRDQLMSSYDTVEVPNQ